MYTNCNLNRCQSHFRNIGSYYFGIIDFAISLSQAISGNP